MAAPSPHDIQELVNRLKTREFSCDDIREAGELLASALPTGEGYKQALELFTSTHEQVRILGIYMMQFLAPRLPAAKAFLDGIKDAARILGFQAPLETTSPKGPDYSSIGQVIKSWLKESRASQGYRPQRNESLPEIPGLTYAKSPRSRYKA